jgi:hypothetical protein
MGTNPILGSSKFIEVMMRSNLRLNLDSINKNVFYPDRLSRGEKILQVAGLLLKSFIVSILLAASGLLIILFFSSQDKLSCTRVAPEMGKCLLENKKLIAETRAQFNLKDIEGVEVDTKNFKGDRPYVIMLSPGSGKRIVSFDQSTLSDFSMSYSAADKLKKFLTDPEKAAVIIRQSNRLPGYITGSALILSGIFVMMLTGLNIFKK